MFSEAEDAFTQVLKLDKNCEDAVQELLRVRIQQIVVSLVPGAKIPNRENFLKFLESYDKNVQSDLMISWSSSSGNGFF